MRRALLGLAMAALAVVAIYHFTVAATLALETRFSDLHAQLIVASIFTALSGLSYAILWAIRRKPAEAKAPVLSQSRETKLAMLIEAAMLGFELAKKGRRSR
jgi:hypothetical protein